MKAANWVDVPQIEWRERGTVWEAWVDGKCVGSVGQEARRRWWVDLRGSIQDAWYEDRPSAMSALTHHIQIVETTPTLAELDRTMEEER